MHPVILADAISRHGDARRDKSSAGSGRRRADTRGSLFKSDDAVRNRFPGPTTSKRFGTRANGVVVAPTASKSSRKSAPRPRGVALRGKSPSFGEKEEDSRKLHFATRTYMELVMFQYMLIVFAQLLTVDSRTVCRQTRNTKVTKDVETIVTTWTRTQHRHTTLSP